MIEANFISMFFRKLSDKLLNHTAHTCLSVAHMVTTSNVILWSVQCTLYCVGDQRKFGMDPDLTNGSGSC
jgi:hypothetical protein